MDAKLQLLLSQRKLALRTLRKQERGTALYDWWTTHLNWVNGQLSIRNRELRAQTKKEQNRTE